MGPLLMGMRTRGYSVKFTGEKRGPESGEESYFTGEQEPGPEAGPGWVMGQLTGFLPRRLVRAALSSLASLSR
jgi:hypothetical protein